MLPRTRALSLRSSNSRHPTVSAFISTSTLTGSTFSGVSPRSTWPSPAPLPAHPFLSRRHEEDLCSQSLPAYGYDCSATAENNAALQSLATAARTAIAGVSGTAYTIGKSCSTLYATTGSSVDYIDATGNATYSYTYELRDKGTYGFVLPANQITPTAVETWAGVLVMLQRA